MTQPPPGSIELALDEMFSPKIAAILRDKGHAVVAVAERDDLRSMTDEDLYAWAGTERCWLLTENVKDFRPIMLRALQSGGATPGLLYTSSRTFRRSRQDPGPLVRALHSWLTNGPPALPMIEDWLPNVDDQRSRPT